MKFVPFDKIFYTRKSCPYCGGNESVQSTGWLIDEDRYPRKVKKQLKKSGRWPLWIADSVDIDCVNMPDPADEAWDRWWTIHDDPMPYVNFLPHQIKIENSLKHKYRFYEQNSTR